jgi:hypothetical protein
MALLSVLFRVPFGCQGGLLYLVGLNLGPQASTTWGNVAQEHPRGKGGKIEVKWLKSPSKHELGLVRHLGAREAFPDCFVPTTS